MCVDIAWLTFSTYTNKSEIDQRRFLRWCNFRLTIADCGHGSDSESRESVALGGPLNGESGVFEFVTTRM